MDILDDIGPGERQQIVVAGQVLMPVGKPLTSEVRLGKFERLDHRAHSPVEHENPLAEQGL